jgi:hypothetical protein
MGLIDLFRGVRLVAKSAYYIRRVGPSVRTYVRISSAPTGRISMKFDTGDFNENLLIKSKFRYHSVPMKN